MMSADVDCQLTSSNVDALTYDRKHCAVCKCPRNAHDVVQKESVNVHDRLGLDRIGAERRTGSTGRGAGAGASAASNHPDHQHHQTMVMANIQPARPSSSDVYSWIPAGVAAHQVSFNFDISKKKISKLKKKKFQYI